MVTDKGCSLQEVRVSWGCKKQWVHGIDGPCVLYWAGVEDADVRGDKYVNLNYTEFKYMNLNYTELKFPKINTHLCHKVRLRRVVVCLRVPVTWGWVVLKCRLTNVELGVGFPKAHAIGGG